jgi:hypothetical protein
MACKMMMAREYREGRKEEEKRKKKAPTPLCVSKLNPV